MVYVVKEWSVKSKVPASECVFLATHERCCLCISAIVWAIFRKVVFLFPYETTRDQGIPHDLRIMHELWQVERYNPTNEFCSAAGLLPLIDEGKGDEVRSKPRATCTRIEDTYNSLSATYQTEKSVNASNTLAFN